MNQVTLRPHQTKTVKAMLYHKKGQVIVPTGGGKTMCMISDAINEFTRTNISQTIVVVAPRILLAQQLCEEFLEQIKNVDVLHQNILYQQQYYFLVSCEVNDML